MADVEVTERIQAPALRLYELVSDLPRMGEWSPENTGGSWLGGAKTAAVGARFRGTNRAGWRFWMTSVTVTAADPGRRFAFDVHAFGIPVSTWDYTFTDIDGHCVVTEAWTDRRPRWMQRVSKPITGVGERGTHNRANMQETLRRLKATAEL